MRFSFKKFLAYYKKGLNSLCKDLFLKAQYDFGKNTPGQICEDFLRTTSD